MSLLEDSKSISAVRVDKELTERFRVTVGWRQGSNLSTYLFNIEAMIRRALESVEVGVHMDGGDC